MLSSQDDEMSRSWELTEIFQGSPEHSLQALGTQASSLAMLTREVLTALTQAVNVTCMKLGAFLQRTTARKWFAVRHHSLEKRSTRTRIVRAANDVWRMLSKVVTVFR